MPESYILGLQTHIAEYLKRKKEIAA